MDLQLKNVYFSERLSEETNAFTADVWFRGKKVGYAKNDGHGGCTYIHSYGPEVRDQFREAEEYAKSLPDIEYDGSGGLPSFTLNSNLENVVDKLFQDWLENKEFQRMQRKGIFYQKPNGQKETTYWKGWPTKKLLESGQGRAMLYNTILKLQKEGNVILNTNLGSLLPEKG